MILHEIPREQPPGPPLVWIGGRGQYPCPQPTDSRIHRDRINAQGGRAVATTAHHSCIRIVFNNTHDDVYYCTCPSCGQVDIVHYFKTTTANRSTRCDYCRAGRCPDIGAYSI